MDKIILTKEKLSEILNDINDGEKMEYYYNAATDGNIVAYHHGAFVVFFIALVKHYEDKIF